MLVPPGEEGTTCAGFIPCCSIFIASRIPRIEQIMTDNAWAYRHSLTTVVAELGATQMFIKPHCPWQNGKVERFTRTFQTEWVYRHPLYQQHRKPGSPYLLAEYLPTPAGTGGQRTSGRYLLRLLFSAGTAVLRRDCCSPPGLLFSAGTAVLRRDC